MNIGIDARLEISRDLVQVVSAVKAAYGLAWDEVEAARCVCYL